MDEDERRRRRGGPCRAVITEIVVKRVCQFGRFSCAQLCSWSSCPVDALRLR